MGEHTVLIADDSKMMRRMYEGSLKGSEFNVVALCENGIEAVDKFSELKPEFVILDIVMPESTGIDALRKIIPMDANVKAIMMSSIGTEENVEECLKLGAKTFIQKPINQELLLKTLRDLV